MGKNRSGRVWQVFDFRTKLKRQKRRRWQTPLTVLGGAALVGAAAGLGSVAWPSGSASVAAPLDSPQFAVCGTSRETCVVDGDTFWLDGVKIRIADIDTPEISEPQCDWEHQQGIKARDALVVLLNQGQFELSPIGERDEDRYGRKLRVVTRDGVSLGNRLVSEGLARTWTGRREPWC